MNNSCINYLIRLVKKEAILTIAICMAVVSCFFVHPNKKYIEYIDYRTIVILFSLMVVMEAYKRIGVFSYIAEWLLAKSNNITYIVFVLVALCFFFSMLITNDVALITFVPFSFTVLNRLDNETSAKLFIPIVAMQTVAANLGSMLTPVGNPQNLYIYSVGKMEFFNFVHLMAPYSIVGFCILLISTMFVCRNQGRAEEKIDSYQVESQMEPLKLLLYSVMFLLCLCSVFRMIDYKAVGLVIFVAILLVDKSVLMKIDYSLLLTFVFFFIFVGNVGKMEWFSTKLGGFVDGSEFFLSITISQVISNVPAALLLSDFTNNLEELIVGLDVAGFGTIIASMASLISFRQVAREKDSVKWKYLFKFTVYNIVVLCAMIAVYYISKNNI
ncbi:MAG: citrate transporter [Lachnospiraceae bacterium]|nr:citrate transporter [Lachnospiraceae bacterium]